MIKKIMEALRQRAVEWNATQPAGTQGKIDLTFRALELAGELGEACNIAKKIARERLGLRGKRATKEQLAYELGDAMICVLNICIDEDIDPEKAIITAFNNKSEEMGFKTRIPLQLGGTFVINDE